MIAGQRFELDLGDDESLDGKATDTSTQGAFVGDVLERKPTASATPPAPPTLKSKDGFPEHRKRNVESRFKQRNTHAKVQSTPSGSGRENVPEGAVTTTKSMSWEEEEKQRIDQENQHKLDQMSPQEIEEERRELMQSLSPALLQRLLQRSNINSGSSEQNLSSESQQLPPRTTETPKQGEKKSVSFVEPTIDDTTSDPSTNHIPNNNDDMETPLAESQPTESIHFPRPPQPPDLDPSSSTFLTDLHEKYFPSLPTDPSKLEWMQPSTSATISPYDPSLSTLQPKNLRFSFTGALLAPRTAAAIPVTAGLHHHGDAPEAAGYTIAELARLAQSAYAAQRCIAFQTLGRILYRLGKGEFGDEGEAKGADEEEGFGELARGLWREVDREKVVEILVRESEGLGVDRGRHVSAKAYATEAVWLWRKGGGRRWKAE